MLCHQRSYYYYYIILIYFDHQFVSLLSSSETPSSRSWFNKFLSCNFSYSLESIFLPSTLALFVLSYLALAIAMSFSSIGVVLIWYFIVSSSRFVCMNFAKNGISGNSLSLKKAINKNSNIIGDTKIAAMALLKPFFTMAFRIPSAIATHHATTSNCISVTLIGHTWNHTFSRHQSIFLGKNTFI